MINDRYHYSRLSGREKKVYKKIYECLNAFEPKIHILTSEGIGISTDKILLAVDMDNPHLFHVDFRNIRGYVSAFEQILVPSYIYTSEKTRDIQIKVRNVLHKILARVNGSTEYEKVLSLHDVFVNNVLYDFEAAENLDYYAARSNTVLGVLFFKTAVCEGIAKTVKLLLNAMDIKCIVVIGKADMPEGKATDADDTLHAWNIIKIDGVPYHMDVTWDVNLSDKSSIRHDYFALSDAYMAKDHEIDKKLPPCPDDDKNYYSHNDMVVRTKGDLAKIVTGAVQKGDCAVTFRWENVPGITEDKIAKVTLDTLSRLLTNRKTVTINYAVNPDQNIMSVKW